MASDVNTKRRFQSMNQSPSRNSTKKVCLNNLKNQPDEILYILNNEDDSIFSNLNLPKDDGGDNISKLDLFFGDNEDLNLFHDTERNEKINIYDQQHCTQRFFDDLNTAMMLPSYRETVAFENHSKIFTKPTYQSRNENQQLVPLAEISVKHNETKNGLNIDDAMIWATEIFDQQITAVEQNIDLIPIKGPFYNLPIKVKQLIQEHKGINKLYDWQGECLNLPAIKKRKNLIYALPTSGGKTLVSEILMLKEIICREKNVLFVLPYVSIVQEKFSAMTPFALSLNFNVEEYAGGKGKCPPSKRYKRKTIYICSIEKGAILFNSLIEANRANEIGLVVIDELHLVGEKGRGATLESFLTKVMFSNVEIQIVGMSATIGNISELSEFLNADIYTRGFRPVELKEYIKCGNDILTINPCGKTPEELFQYCRTIDFKYSASVLKADPDHLAGLVSEVIPDNSCLVFCSTRKNCENVSILLTKILSKKKYLNYRQPEKSILLDALEKLCGQINPVLAETIPFGIAFHHSGLLTDERKLLEIAFRVGTLCVICCTSTLAAGVNLPAKRVIIRAPYVGNKFMSLSQYKQMIGRAGRTGMGEAGESILIFPSKDNLQVGQMLSSPMDNVISSLTENNYIGLENLLLSAIGLKLADCMDDLLKLVKRTLAFVQRERFELDITEKITLILKNMFKKKVLKIIDANLNNQLKSNHSIITTQEMLNNNNNSNTGVLINNTKERKRFVLSRSTKFDLSKLGKAAYKAGISYERAEFINSELNSALQSLVLLDYSHLLYLVVSLNGSDITIVAEPNVLFRELNQLNGGIKYLVKVVGITDNHIARMFKNLSIKGPVEQQLWRLYVVFILRDIISLIPFHTIAKKYLIELGLLQNLLIQSCTSANTIIRLCEEIEEFWCYRPLLEKLNVKLDRCTTVELEPLLELPSVKSARARQFFTAGFRTIEDIAKARPGFLVRKIEHLNMKTAKEIISAAKLILLRRLEDIEQETNSILECLK